MNRDGCVRQHEQRRQKQRLIAPPNILPNTDGLPVSFVFKVKFDL